MQNAASFVANAPLGGGSFAERRWVEERAKRRCSTVAMCAKQTDARGAFEDATAAKKAVLRFGCNAVAGVAGNVKESARDYDGRVLDVGPELRDSCVLYEFAVQPEFVQTFRMSSPYINLFRGRTFVVHLPFELLAEQRFEAHLQDIALLVTIGIHVVLVLGVDYAARREMEASGFCIDTDAGSSLRVPERQVVPIPRAALAIAKQMCGKMLFEVEAKLTRGLYNAPVTRRLEVISGNFFTAMPLGVRGGVDFGSAGAFRRLETEAVRARLERNDVVVLSNIGFSPSGELFFCPAEQVAERAAIALGAEKLIFLASAGALVDARRKRIVENLPVQIAEQFVRRLDARDAQKNAASAGPDESFVSALRSATAAVRGGVRRAHLLNRFVDGALVMEVFHRDGVGTMVCGDVYEGIRPARAADMPGIAALLEPLEKAGVVLFRERSAIEADLANWVIVERDGAVLGCAALKRYAEAPDIVELGPLAVSPKYRSSGKGNALLSYMERVALAAGARRMMILSTVSFEWFLERGFREGTRNDMPPSRAAAYSTGRGSKIFFKQLNSPRAIDSEDVLRL